MLLFSSQRPSASFSAPRSQHVGCQLVVLCLLQCLLSWSVHLGQHAEATAALLTFWTSFLRSNFDQGLHQDFQGRAAAELDHGRDHSAVSLFFFYTSVLAQSFQPVLYRQFEQSALKVFPSRRAMIARSSILPMGASATLSSGAPDGCQAHDYHWLACRLD